MKIDIINKIQLLRKVKFRFDLPKRNEILQLDEHNSESLKKAIKRNFNIVPQRKREIYF